MTLTAATDQIVSFPPVLNANAQAVSSAAPLPRDCQDCVRFVMPPPLVKTVPGTEALRMRQPQVTADGEVLAATTAQIRQLLQAERRELPADVALAVPLSPPFPVTRVSSFLPENGGFQFDIAKLNQSYSCRMAQPASQMRELLKVVTRIEAEQQAAATLLARKNVELSGQNTVEAARQRTEGAVAAAVTTGVLSAGGAVRGIGATRNAADSLRDNKKLALLQHENSISLRNAAGGSSVLEANARKAAERGALYDLAHEKKMLRTQKMNYQAGAMHTSAAVTGNLASQSYAIGEAEDQAAARRHDSSTSVFNELSELKRKNKEMAFDLLLEMNAAEKQASQLDAAIFRV